MAVKQASRRDIAVIIHTAVFTVLGGVLLVNTVSQFIAILQVGLELDQFSTYT